MRLIDTKRRHFDGSSHQRLPQIFRVLIFLQHKVPFISEATKETTCKSTSAVRENQLWPIGLFIKTFILLAHLYFFTYVTWI